MIKIIREMRRREVFRTTGLYAGISWILIEGASVLLPAFEAPDWVLRAMIMTAIIGLPIVIVLAWFLDITSSGIEWQASTPDKPVDLLGSRRMDFVVIAVLSVALIFSIYLNIRHDGGNTVAEPLAPVSVLIADFQNRTGDSLFDATLEQALQIGIESAPFISGYRREAALRQAQRNYASNTVLDEATARLIAVREGIKLVLAGSIEEDSGRYKLDVRGIDPKNGEVLISTSVDAKEKLDVLTAIGTVAGDLREELGDKGIDRDKLITSETFTANNLEAVQSYSAAQSLQYSGKYNEAMTYYRLALEHDPNFGRAYSGLALSAHALGRTDEAAELWGKALANMDTMTERERLRTQGLYFSVVTRNFAKAIETYEKLIAKFPADDAAHNGLAVQRFYALDFDGAREAGGNLLDIYPTSVMGRSNYALYAMYASDFEKAVAEADTVRAQDPDYFKAWLPIAISYLASGDTGAATDAYNKMRESGTRGGLTAALGMADVAMYSGDIETAVEQLAAGIDEAESAGSQYFLATLSMVRAEALAASGADSETVAQHVAAALDVAAGLSRQVPAALLSIDIGDTETARTIATQLAGSLQSQNRAYGEMIRGVIELEASNHVAAIDLFNAGKKHADLWLLRFYRGRAFLAAGFYAEALDEFLVCNARRGEASALFLDDVPTYRYMATLPYWQARAQQELGMTDAARENFARFVDHRPSGALVDDARQRLN